MPKLGALPIHLATRLVEITLATQPEEAAILLVIPHGETAKDKPFAALKTHLAIQHTAVITVQLTAAAQIVLVIQLFAVTTALRFVAVPIRSAIQHGATVTAIQCAVQLTALTTLLVGDRHTSD